MAYAETIKLIKKLDQLIRQDHRTGETKLSHYKII